MKNRANYTTEEKLAIVREVLSRKRSIQRIGEEKGIAPTLISLWKKQAEDAMSERFQPRPKKAIVNCAGCNPPPHSAQWHTKRP